MSIKDDRYHTTESEISFINSMRPKYLKGYVEALSKRTDWARLDRVRVTNHAKMRLEIWLAEKAA